MTTKLRSRAPVGLLCSIAVCRELVGIKKQKPRNKGFSVCFQTLNTLDCHVDTCEGISGTATEIRQLQMKRQIPVANDIPQPTSIAHFTLPFAADENRSALGLNDPWPSHPIWGTAP